MKITTCISALLWMMTSAVPASVIYDADFDSAVSIDHDNTSNTLESSPQSGGNFTIGYSGTPQTDGTRNFFETSEGKLISSDFGGSHFMRSSIIDVSGWTEASISVVTDFRGTDSFNDSPTEFIEYFYTLDGGSETGFFSFTDSPNGSNLNASLASLDLSGNSTMTIGLNANVNGDGDGFSISSYTVTGVTPIPEPSTGLPVAVLCAASLFIRCRAI